NEEGRQVAQLMQINFYNNTNLSSQLVNSEDYAPIQDIDSIRCQVCRQVRH
ncbi:MAG: hypothetical protein ACI81F_002259, partial [Thalassolituus oleivorans]